MSSYKEQREHELKWQKEILPYYEKHMHFTPDRSTACRDYDFTFISKGKTYKVEEKFRTVNYGDFLIEIIQDVFDRNAGWYYETKADYIFYVVEMKYIYIVRWDLFKHWLSKNWKDANISARVSTKGYGLTINLSIKWDKISPSVYERRTIDLF